MPSTTRHPHHRMRGIGVMSSGHRAKPCGKRTICSSQITTRSPGHAAVLNAKRTLLRKAASPASPSRHRLAPQGQYGEFSRNFPHRHSHLDEHAPLSSSHTSPPAPAHPFAALVSFLPGVTPTSPAGVFVRLALARRRRRINRTLSPRRREAEGEQSSIHFQGRRWIPAYAGMTMNGGSRTPPHPTLSPRGERAFLCVTLTPSPRA